VLLIPFHKLGPIEVVVVVPMARHKHFLLMPLLLLLRRLLLLLALNPLRKLGLKEYLMVNQLHGMGKAGHLTNGLR
jgi:hypothetical protein